MAMELWAAVYKKVYIYVANVQAAKNMLWIIIAIQSNLTLAR